MHAAVAGFRPSEIVCSPLSRCQDVATELAERLSVPLRADERWIEYDFGEWTGQNAAQVYQHSPDALARFWNDPEGAPPPGAEPMAIFVQRIKSACLELSNSAMVISHGGPGRLLRTWQHNLPTQKLAEQSVSLAECFEFDLKDIRL